MKHIKWGVLSTSKFGINHIIPAIGRSRTGTVQAIASRNTQHAAATAERLHIPKSYGSYEELLTDETIDAIYNPLPNHLHVPWTIKALEAGKHVLCEKPIALSRTEAERLLQKSLEFPHLKVMEAFMYRFHPQWIQVRSLVQNGAIGKVSSIQSVFTYFNDDPANIRNSAAMGGGGLMDIGCYCISLSRFLYGEEPESVTGQLEIEPSLGVDWKASGILTFGEKTATFTCSTRLQNYQNVVVFGKEGLIEMDRPFNPPPNQPAYIHLTKNGQRETIEIPAVDQYQQQVDLFGQAIIDTTAVPTPLHDAVANMAVIDAMFISDKERRTVLL
ncbi:MAG: Gfo/Idh/MocA family oxidoreductase [Bacteroidetes bacterium]|nr:Gfo/Idh/MocA family oxidoreductase [Bacteroidota bacterium]